MSTGSDSEGHTEFTQETPDLQLSKGGKKSAVKNIIELELNDNGGQTLKKFSSWQVLPAFNR